VGALPWRHGESAMSNQATFWLGILAGAIVAFAAHIEDCPARPSVGTDTQRERPSSDE